MDRIILLICIIAIISTGIVAGVFGLHLGQGGRPEPTDYVLKSGECWVHPQGDPLYDEHYAKNVNVQNCQSYKMQEQAKQITATARDIRWNTTSGMMGVYTVLGVVVAIVALLIVAIIRG